MRKGRYGLEAWQEERKEKVLRDVRGPAERFFGALFRREGTGLFGLLMLSLMYLYPGFWPLPLAAFSLLVFVRFLLTRKDHLPMRMPKGFSGHDYNAPRAGGFRPAEGMFYLGNADGSLEELWIGRDDILTHMLVLGTTGAGKTETLVSLAFNYFAVGSGFIYVDPKAAPRLAVQIWTMARMLGREDDFLVISYMADRGKTMRNQTSEHHGRRKSNTQNPFAVGDANSLTQLLFALMPSDENGQSSIFSSNAQALISGLLFVLVERRDMGLEPLSIETIRSYLMNIPKIDALARDERYSETASLALQAGLATVGWDKSRDLSHQPKNFPEQYGYARAYFGRALSLLVDNYGHIFRVSHGEVDAVDVITNRRIFLTLIPSMDKDPKELKNLGQICLASVRNACAVGLGGAIQGRVSDVLGALPTASPVPFGVIVDEYAAIETPGFEILLTQGRGLGMAVIVASQDFAGIRRASEAAAEQIVSNSKIKLFMTTEDPRQTAELVQKLAGQGYVLKSSGFAVDREHGGSTYHDSCQVNSERLERVDFRDLQKQTEGEVTISFKGEIIRGRTFYANPPLAPSQHVRLNVFLQCGDPNVDELLARFGAHRNLVGAFLARARLKMDGRAGDGGWEEYGGERHEVEEYEEGYEEENGDNGDKESKEDQEATDAGMFQNGSLALGKKAEKTDPDYLAGRVEEEWEEMERCADEMELSGIGAFMRGKKGSVGVADRGISAVCCLDSRVFRKNGGGGLFTEEAYEGVLFSVEEDDRANEEENGFWRGNEGGAGRRGLKSGEEKILAGGTEERTDLMSLDHGGTDSDGVCGGEFSLKRGKGASGGAGEENIPDSAGELCPLTLEGPEQGKKECGKKAGGRETAGRDCLVHDARPVGRGDRCGTEASGVEKKEKRKPGGRHADALETLLNNL
ncbi:MAG: TraM recognition domain-containing protein [Desulfovibrio sp.]|nr:TraM recognition domain-containing protein [Desulfovibrio sp.]